MVLPTHKNHLQHYYMNEKREYRQASRFFVQVGECEQEPRQPMTEAIRAAQIIYENAKGQPLGLCMSGGIDSECMAEAFLAAKVPFTVYTLRFQEGLNDFDIRQVAPFCEAHGIQHQYVDIDILNFFESGRYLDFAKTHRCISPQLVTHLYLLEQMDAIPILSWNPTAVYIKEAEPFLNLPTDLYFSYERFFENTGREGVGLFFIYTPELFYSFLRTLVMQNILLQRGPAFGFDSSYWSKCVSYTSGGFKAQPRKDKQTGFEQLKMFLAEKYNAKEDTFNRLYRRPLEELFPPTEQLVQSYSKKYLYVSDPTNVETPILL